MKTPSLISKNLDHHGLVAGFCKEVGVAKLIDAALPEQSKQKHISYGQLVEAMILNGLGFTGRTLHMYSQYFQDKPLERLLGEGIKAEHINDDALGRCLDSLFEHGVSDIYQQLSEAVIDHLELPCEAINIDTTSFHVDGDYKTDDDCKGIRLTKGYSRDHRPELNQAILSLITENQAGIPVYMKAHSGNSQDGDTFKKLVKSHISSLKAAQKSRYLIGDSSLYVAETIQTLNFQKQYFITRVPQKIKEASQLLINASSLEFINLENGYRGAWVESNYGEVKQKWLVVHSEQANHRELKTLDKRIEKSLTASEKSFKKLCQRSFSCHDDAVNALERWQEKQNYAQIEKSKVKPVVKHKKRGRPALGSEGETHYQVQGTVTLSQNKKHRAESTLGLFILSTNDTSKKLDMQKMLNLYKSQQKVEGGFRFLKSPDFLVSSFFLKKPERIEALLMVMTCCLMVYAALEYLIRKNLVNTDSYFPDMKKQPSQNPTARWVFYCFQGIHQITIEQELIITVINNIEDKHFTILDCLGSRYRAIYSGN